jgi:hypothetical protein
MKGKYFSVYNIKMTRDILVRFLYGIIFPMTINVWTLGPFIRAKISRGLNKPRLIFARINGPIVCIKKVCFLNLYAAICN